MQGRIEINTVEVQNVIQNWLRSKGLGEKLIITQIKSAGYSSYSPALEVNFTDEPDEPAGESEQ